jgi:hypothetical protein
MYRPELVRVDDPDLSGARRRSSGFLYGPAAALVKHDAVGAGIAGWSMAHGIVSLWANGNLPDELDDPEHVMRLAGRHLFASGADAERPRP